MTESTARAGRLDAQATPFYIWDVPQKPVVAHISLGLVERLEREVVESFRSVNSRGSEIGGLLLGTVSPGARPVVVIDGYEPVPCEYARGPLYRLSEKDKAAFDAAIKRLAASGATVVGWFRSNTRKGLALDADDLAIFAERFRDPARVTLLVRPFATKASVAGLFVWENGTVSGESSSLEFPFTTAELSKRELTSGLPRRQDKPAEPAPAAAPPPRAQVVPIASRREAPAAPPPVVAQAEPEPRRESQPEPQPQPKAQTQPQPKSQTQPQPQPQPKSQTLTQPQPQPEPRAEAAAAQAAPETEAPPEEKPAGGFKLSWMLAGVAALVLATILFFYPGLLLRRGGPKQAPAAENNSLALRVERASGQFLLTWNRDAEAVKTATKAVLFISDGERKENVDLDLAQLRNGSVVYAPLTADVNFRLEITSSQPGKSQSEYVRVLGAGISPLDTTAPKDQAQAQAKPAAAANPQAAEEQPTPGEAPAAPSTPRRQFVPTLASRLSPATPADIPEPPKLEGGAQMPAGLGAGLSTPQPNLAPPPAAPQSPAPPAQGSAPLRIGGQVQEAKLIASKSPVYPPLARQARVQGIVHLEATIGKDGRVKDVRVLSGHPLLGPAAVTAVKEWIYRPSILNGQPTEVTTKVQVAFALDK